MASPLPRTLRCKNSARSSDARFAWSGCPWWGGGAPRGGSPQQPDAVAVRRVQMVHTRVGCSASQRREPEHVRGGERLFARPGVPRVARSPRQVEPDDDEPVGAAFAAMPKRSSRSSGCAPRRAVGRLGRASRSRCPGSGHRDASWYSSRPRAQLRRVGPRPRAPCRPASAAGHDVEPGERAPFPYGSQLAQVRASGCPHARRAFASESPPAGRGASPRAVRNAHELGYPIERRRSRRDAAERGHEVGAGGARGAVSRHAARGSTRSTPLGRTARPAATSRGRGQSRRRPARHDRGHRHAERSYALKLREIRDLRRGPRRARAWEHEILRDRPQHAPGTSPVLRIARATSAA